MQESTNTITARKKVTERVGKSLGNVFDNLFSNKYLFRSFAAITLFTLSFWIIYPSLYKRGDLVKSMLALYGFVVLFFIVLIIVEFFVKQARLHSNNTSNLSLRTSLNVIFGLILPLFYGNLIVGSIMKILQTMSNHGTFLCELRRSVVAFYYHNHVYYQTNQLLMLLLTMTVVLIVIGSFVEKVLQKK